MQNAIQLLDIFTDNLIKNLRTTVNADASISAETLADFIGSAYIKTVDQIIDEGPAREVEEAEAE